MILLDPIGTVETPFQSLSEAPSQGFLEQHRGTIKLRPRLSHALEGLTAGQLVDVVWYANGADRSLLRLEETKGVFASRSQDRPNPIAITRCRIVAIEGNEIEIEGVDMIDGTPIVDIKPTFNGPGQERTPSPAPPVREGQNATD